MRFDNWEDAFIEDALSEADALTAAERFYLQRESQGFVFQLVDESARNDVNLVSKDELMELVDFHMEQGGRVRLSN